MEHAIGEVVTLPDGRKVEVVKGNAICTGCLCEEENIECLGQCASWYRPDHKNIIYKEIKAE